jgi:hypothetical protein
MNTRLLPTLQSAINTVMYFVTALLTSSRAYPVLVLLLFLHVQTGLAQFGPTGQSAAEVNSSRGYWRIKTMATTRSTIVQFFGASNQLLYEEILSQKWVKLSRKNQKQFDQLLAQLVANQLLTARIKTEVLPSSPIESVPLKALVKSNPTPTTASTSTSYQVNAYVSQSGKLYLVVNNPEQLRYKIAVVDGQNRSLYEEFTNNNQYRRKLDLSALSDNSCQLVVQIDNKPVVYSIKRQNTRFAFSIQPDSIVRREAANSQNQEEKKPLLMPVNIDL